MRTNANAKSRDREGHKAVIRAVANLSEPVMVRKSSENAARERVSKMAKPEESAAEEEGEGGADGMTPEVLRYLYDREIERDLLTYAAKVPYETLRKIEAACQVEKPKGPDLLQLETDAPLDVELLAGPDTEGSGPLAAPGKEGGRDYYEQRVFASTTGTLVYTISAAFWVIDGGKLFAAVPGGKAFRIPFIERSRYPEIAPDVFDYEFRRFAHLWNERNRRFGVEPPEGIVLPAPLDPFDPDAPPPEPAPDQGRPSAPARAASLLRLPAVVKHYTFIEAREVHRAIGDAPALTNWRGIQGDVALLHAIPGEPLQTKFKPSIRLQEYREWAGVNLVNMTEERLIEELRALDFDGNLLFGVCLSLCIDGDGGQFFTATLDDLGAAIGWDPRTLQEREENRLKLWHWLLLFDSLRVIGARNGKYKDPRTGKEINLTSDDDLFHLGGVRQERLDGVGYEVTVTAGPWVQRFRDDKRILTYLGNLRTLASKPRGKLAPRLAVKAGLSLDQVWREHAARPTTKVKAVGDDNRLSVEFVPLTRQELMTTLGHGMAQEIEHMLAGKDPGRVRAGWKEAMDLLREWGIVGHYREIDPMPDGRKGWADFWYTKQRLDIRPAREIAEGVAAVKSAKTAADRARRRGGAGKGRRPAEAPA